MSSSSQSNVRRFTKQLGALLWKCLLIRRFYYFATAFECLGPLVITIGYLIFASTTMTNHNSSADTNKTLGPIYYNESFENILFDTSNDFVLGFTLYVAPANSPTAERLLRPFCNQSQIHMQTFANESELDDALLRAIGQQSSFSYSRQIGIVFENENDNTMTPADKNDLAYRLKVPADESFMQITAGKFPAKPNREKPISDYPEHIAVYSKFSTIQAYLNREYLKFLCTLDRKSVPPICEQLDKPIVFNRMPYPKYRNIEVNPLQNFLSFILPIGCIFACPLIVLRITEEKSGKAKELLRMIGLSDFVFWLAHFLDHFVVFAVHAIIFTIVLFTPIFNVFSLSSPILFLLIYIIFAAQLTLFILFMTTILNKPSLAINLVYLVLSGILTAAIMLTPANQPSIDVPSTNPVRVFLAFFPPASIIWYISIMGTIESEGVALDFGTVNFHSQVYGNFTAAQVLIAMIASCFIYSFLIFYLDAVMPYQHGVPKPVNFLCSLSYWWPKRSAVDTEIPDSDNPYRNSCIYEPDPVGLNAMIRIKNLTKCFAKSGSSKPKKPAVDNLWLNIYENQITVLLGHNGAGKTTTMNMITGMYPGSTGSIYVDNFNVFTETREARASIGLCSQENIQFKELTTEQHLRLFALLKDYPAEKVDQEVNEILELLRLTEKRDVLSTKLSGGMKRKLSLGIALVGGTKTLILDEPTSGMDPDTRRVIWDLLLAIRRKRTVLLTTHYMEEADILGDRIAIMNEGKLSCVGTPFFLKKTYGTGYRLRIAKQDVDGQPRFSSDSFLAIIRTYIPSVSLSTDIETEVVFSLETANVDRSEKKKLMTSLTDLFQDMEQNKSKYGIDSFGLSYSTLEDVFLAVGSDLDLNVTTAHSESRIGNSQLDDAEADAANDAQFLLSKKSDLISGTELLRNQIVALFVKRFNYARRYWKTIMLQAIIPTAFVIAGVSLQASVRNSKGSVAPKTVSLLMDVEKIYGPKSETWYSVGSTGESFEWSYRQVNEQLYRANTSIVPANVVSGDEIDKWILTQIDDDIPKYISKYLYGVGDRTESINVWINFEQYHSLPLAVNVLYESMLNSLRFTSQPNANRSAQIRVESRPIMSAQNSQSSQITMLIVSWAVSCFSVIPNAFLYLGASFILQPIRENASKAKLLQLMTGLSPVTFWFVNYFFDLLMFLAISLVLVIFHFVLDADHLFFGSLDSATALIALFITYGVAIIPFAYVLSYFFDKTSRGLSVMMQIGSYLGSLIGAIFGTGELFFVYFDMHLRTLEIFYQIFLYIFRVIPGFSIIFGYQKLYKLVAFANYCQKLDDAKQLNVICENLPANQSSIFKGCCPELCGDSCFRDVSPWGFSQFSVLPEMIYMLVVGCVCYAAVVSYELNKQQFSAVFSAIKNFINRFLQSFRRKKANFNPMFTTESGILIEDGDVLREKSRIDHNNANIDLLTVRKLTKQFGSLIAVDQLSFGVRAEECFGLLGVNGAGKTTTFSMLTGDIPPTSGDAFILSGRYGLLSHMRSVQQSIGYCPQYDALLSKLTGEEMLLLLARLRGIPWHAIQRNVRQLIRMTGLEAHATERIDSYSGGTKRKLSIALALVGSPSLLLLDEPTSGVDPVARRKIWQTLGAVKRHSASSIVISSHSMEECEALCTRIGIMVSGRFRCLGSPQHLRSRYGQGYSVTISLRKKSSHSAADESDEYVAAVKRSLESAIPSAILKDHHQSLLLYHIADQAEKWSHIFAQMSALNDQFDFEDYYVADTTLEQIFIMFARHQTTDRDGDEGKDGSQKKTKN